MQLEQQTNYILSFDDDLEIPAVLKAVGICFRKYQGLFDR